MPPPSRDLREDLRTSHTRFVEALSSRIRPSGPERLALQVRLIVAGASGTERPAPARHRELLAARAHFFLTTDVAKFWLPGSEAAAACDLLSRPEVTLLDLHAGLGTATAGIAILLAASGYRGRLKATLVESDRALAGIARHTLDALAEALPCKVEGQISGSEGTLPGRSGGERHDLVLLFDPMAEQHLPGDPQEARRFLERLLAERVKKTGALLMVDQAARAIARSVAESASLLSAAGYPVHSPCPCPPPGPCECPYASRPGRFCFHSQLAPLTPLVQSAAARSGVDRTEVNYTYLLATGKGSHQPYPDTAAGETAGRIISHPSRVQKGFTYFVCTGREVLQGFAPRLLSDGAIRGGRLPHGTLVVLAAGRSK